MSKTATTRFLEEFPKSLSDDAGAVFVGAGVSMGAGYPSWIKLLEDIGKELGVRSGDVHDLAALAQWSIQENGGATRVRSVIKDKIGVDRPIPAVLETLARLPIRHIWTTNYDRLIERAFRTIDRPIDVVASAGDLAIRPPPGASRLYKMHGSVDHLEGVVISTDDYELFRSRRGAFLPLLQAHLTSMSMLFIGLSFTDPNVRHVLSLIRESFTEAPPEHFAIVRPPQAEDFDSDEQYHARLAQHNLWARDLRRYGLVAVEIEDYAEVPGLLAQIERSVSARRVWVSGSWPVDAHGLETGDVYRFAERLGRIIGESGRDLVSGAGLLVGSAAISGFLEAMRAKRVWDLDRRLIVRPFPQPLAGHAPDKANWTALRQELARQSGIVIFLGGAKLESGAVVDAQGVFDEFEIAQARGSFLLPVGAMGGAAATIARQLVGSPLPSSGTGAVRPTDEELILLADTAADRTALLDCIAAIMNRVKRIA